MTNLQQETEAVRRLIEQAIEGSRELDEAIAVFTKAAANYFDGFDRDIDGFPSHGFADVDGPELCGVASWAGGGRWWEAPHYTTSLDAALTLIPAGWFLHDLAECVMPIRFKEDRHDPTGLFQAGLQWRDGGGRMIRANGHSPALALCIAAMKARLADIQTSSIETNDV